MKEEMVEDRQGEKFGTESKTGGMGKKWYSFELKDQFCLSWDLKP